jgi:peptide/nickel transport system substrate-binding protein
MRFTWLSRSRIPVLLVVMILALSATGVAASSRSGSQFANGRAQNDKTTLIVAVPNDMQNLDPTLSSADTVTQEMLTNVYDWLIDYKVSTDANGAMTSDPSSFVGALAEKYEWNADGTVITFTLRDGLKFSNGDPINAQAVKFTYDRLYDQNGVTPFLMSMAAVPDKNHVTVVDDKTIQIKVDKPNTLLLGNMAQYGHSILDPAVVQPHETADDPYADNWLKSNTAGTEQGPFRLDSWEPGNQWVLVPNENYYGDKPKLQKIIFKVIPDASSRLAQLQSGAVDIAYQLPLKDVKNLQSDPNITIADNPTRGVVFIGMNQNTAPFDNAKVRQAISYAVPYDTILKEVLQGYGKQLTSPIPDGTPYHTDQFFQYKLDYDKAKQLLTEAGFPNGFDATFQIASGVEEGKEIAVWVQQSLAQIGIKVTIQEIPGAAFNEQLQKHELGFFFFNNWISINNDPFYHLFWLFRSDCCDYTNYKNQTVWDLIDKNTLNTDENARQAAAMQIQQTIMDEAPWVFLYQPDSVLAMRSNVKGFVFYSADNFVRYKYIYKE